MAVVKPGSALCVLVVVGAQLAGCAGGDDSEDVEPDLVLPAMSWFPNRLTVTEGGSTTLVVMLDSLGPVRVAPIPLGGLSGQLHVTPAPFDLTPESPSVTLTVTADVDHNAIDEFGRLDLFIGDNLGREPMIDVRVVDPNTPLEILPATTALTMAAQTSRTLGVHLSRPPAAPLTVHVSTDTNLVGVTPVSLDFDSSNYDVAQMLTISNDTANATGGDSIYLDAIGASTVRVDVTVTH